MTFAAPVRTVRGDRTTRARGVASAALFAFVTFSTHIAAQPGDPAYQAADLAYKAQAVNQHAEAAEHAARAVALRPDSAPYRMLLIESLFKSGDADRTRAAMQDALDARAIEGRNAVDAAYMALRLQDDALALTLFDRAAQSQPLAPKVALDAAYTARRTGDRPRAAAYFRQAIDAPTAATELDAQQQFAVRRELAVAEQRWGGSALFTYGPVGLAVGGLPSASGSRRNVTQVGGELFARPLALQPAGGGTVEGFARYFQTLRDAPGAPTGGDTGQGALGLRVKPWDSANVVFEVARLVKIGSASRDDTQLRVAASVDRNTEPPAAGTGDVSWTAWRAYGEANRFVETHQTVALAEAQWGRMFRVGDARGRMTLFPHVLLAASYDDALATPSATSTGLGVSQRIPLGPDWGLSSIGWSLQYRVRLAGDADRARGVFFQVSANF